MGGLGGFLFIYLSIYKYIFIYINKNPVYLHFCISCARGAVQTSGVMLEGLFQPVSRREFAQVRTAAHCHMTPKVD